MSINQIKVRLPHGEWVWVERTEGHPLEGGKGRLLNEPAADCYIHRGMTISFIAVKNIDGSHYLEWDWRSDVPESVLRASAAEAKASRGGEGD